MRKKKDESTIPSSGSGEGNSDYAPFIKARDIGKLNKRATFKLTGDVRMRPDGNFGPEFVAGIRFGGKLYDWSVKIGSGNHSRLEAAFGRNAKRWKGKKVNVQIKHHMANDYIAVVD